MSLFSYAREGGAYMALLVLVSRLFVVLFCTPVHECAHAWMANKLGDGTARVNGRLTLNPLAHFSPIGTIMILVFGIGYAKPVPVNPYNFKNAKKGFALTALAGPVSNFIMAFVAQFISIFLRYANSGGSKGLEAVSLFFFYAALVNVSLAVFNFLPIPPLDGSRIFGLILPDKVYDKFLQYERYIMIGLFALLFTGVLDGVISAITSFVMKVITFIPALIFSNIF